MSSSDLTKLGFNFLFLVEEKISSWSQVEPFLSKHSGVIKKLTAVINIVKKGQVPLLRLNGHDYLIEQKST